MDDLELEKLFELFDRALTSRDERVVNALRSLLMITALTDMGDPIDENATQRPLPVEGPLKKLMRRIDQLEYSMRTLNANDQYKYDYHSAGSAYTNGQVGALTQGIGSITLSGIDYSTASTYDTMDYAAGTTTNTWSDIVTISDKEIEDLLKGIK